MSEILRGQIWLVNLDPIVGHEIKKTRPCVIIQNDYGNKYSNTTIIAPVSSQKLEKVYPVEVLLPAQETGLQNQSKLLLDQIRAIDKQRLIKPLGFVDHETLLKIDGAIKISLGLTSF